MALVRQLKTAVSGQFPSMNTLYLGSQGVDTNPLWVSRILIYTMGLQTTAHGPNQAHKAVICLLKFVDLIECNISWKNHITEDVWPSKCCV